MLYNTQGNQMSKITVTQFETTYMDEDGEVDLPLSDRVEEGDTITEHKHVYNTDVYKVGDQFFAVTFTRDNTGYWSDGESYAPTVVEVFAKTITKVVYE